jgi:hypothetical protein
MLRRLGSARYNVGSQRSALSSRSFSGPATMRLVSTAFGPPSPGH